MATIAQVRALIGDLPRFDRQTATGDGASRHFIVSNYPTVTGSDSITVNDVTVTTYTINPTSGVVSFTAAPILDSEIVILYEYAELSDETITAALALNPNVYTAAALCADSLAGKYASQVDQQVGDLRISFSQRAKQWADMAKRLRASASRYSVFAPYAGGISVADKQANAANADRVKPAFTAHLHDTPGTETAVDDAGI